MLGKVLFTVLFLIPLFIAVEVPIFLAGVALGTYVIYSRELPEIPELKQYQPRTVSTFYADDGTVIGIFYKEKRFVVDLEQIPPQVVAAFLAGEDARFYEHSGVDWRGVARAAVANAKAGRIVQGGSTVSMQVARNFLLSREKRVSRKIKEMILASRLEELWGKKKILFIYLNEIYLGEGCYGVEAAARNYFGKPVEHLSLGEAALIAGLVASPVRFNPFKNEQLARKKQHQVLDKMLRAGFVTREQYERALAEQLQFRKEVTRPFDLVPDFAEEVRRSIIAKYGEEKLYNEGLKVFTTCRVDYQRKAVEALEKGLKELKGRQKHLAILRTIPREQIDEILHERSTPALKEGKLYQAVVTRAIARKDQTDLHIALSKKLRGLVRLTGQQTAYRVGHVLAVHFDHFVDDTALFTLDANPRLEGAFVVIENRTGYVRALVGGSTGDHFKFNRATQGKRQPGSAFKPIIYATAIEKKSYSPATIIVDEPIVVDMERKDEEWEPKNASRDFIGPVSFRRALELSRNICTVKILMDVGLDRVLNLAHEMGITSKMGRNLSLSLGTSEVSLFELTSAYTVFPNSGVYVQPTLITRVEDRTGRVLEDNTQVPMLEADQVPRPVPREELRDQGPTSWLADIADSEAEDGTGSHTRAPGPSALKRSGQTRSGSGTTQRSESGRHLSVEQDDSLPIETSRIARAAVSPQTAYVMTSLLQGGVRSGTGAAMTRYLNRRDLAGKTGTTNNAEDAWFIGFTPDFTAGVWVGFDEKRPLGDREFGARAALPIWAYFMQGVLANRPQKEFPVPPDITFTEMLTITGGPRDGLVPKAVREPVYTPFVGKTLVLSPLDPPEILNQYTAAPYATPAPDPAVSGFVPGGQPYPPAPGPMHPSPPQQPGDGRTQLTPRTGAGLPVPAAMPAVPSARSSRPAQTTPAPAPARR